MAVLPSTNIPKPEAASDTLSGISVRKGLATGPVYHLDSAFPTHHNQPCEDVSAEVRSFKGAVSTAINDLKAIISNLPNDSEERLIFEAHVLMLQDPVLGNQVTSYIQAKQVTAASAWVKVMSDYQKMWENAGAGSNMQNRSSDIADVTKRILRVLHEDVADITTIPEDAVLVTEELSASDALQLDRSRVAAVISERGNDTSHSAILIRSKGIPAIFGVKDACRTLNNSELVVVDADQGLIHRNCSEPFLDEVRSRIAAQSRAKHSAVAASRNPLLAPDHEPIRLLANITDPTQISDANEEGADGVGLFRTEFLFFNRSSAPSEEEQFTVYRNAVSASAGQKLVIRTADFGGDKPLSYATIPVESNPFLGLRGIRFSLTERSMLETQLRALLRASISGPIDIMIPMISTVEEVREVRILVTRIKENLNKPNSQMFNYKLGIMIETPAAVNLIEELLREVDFISIGTNDLAQYTMSADRTNSKVAGLASGWQPAVLRAIARTISAARNARKSVSICGEMAGDADFSPLLVAFGLREFSMSPDRIPGVRTSIESLTSAQIEHLMTRFSGCATASDVQALMDELK